MFFVGVDLGKRHDYTGISITERKLFYDKEYRVGNVLPRIIDVHYYTRYLYRPPLNIPYHDIIRFINELLAKPQLRDSVLVVDATGVGEAVGEMFIEAGLNPILVKITSGAKYNVSDEGYNVPKLDIISILQILLQNGKYKVSRKLKLADHFIKELQTFKYTITAKGYMTMEAQKESVHDDLVMSVGIAMWYAETIAKPIQSRQSRTKEYNPYDFL